MHLLPQNQIPIQILIPVYLLAILLTAALVFAFGSILRFLFRRK